MNDKIFRIALRIRKPEMQEDSLIHLEKHNLTKIFDYIYDQNSTQLEIYESVGKMVQHFFDGFNTTIMAYGQSGSGKTYTMGLKTQTGEGIGLMPRIVNNIFINKNENESFNYEISVSFLELYNNKMIDLIYKSELKKSKKNPKVKDLEIYTDSGTTCIKNLEIKSVTSSLEILTLLEECCKYRVTTATLKNMESSRSHAIFSIYLLNKNNNQKSKFNLIDLAGSEKPSGTGRCEGIAINQGLLSLKLVLNKLSKGEKAIFRGNDLIRILEDTLTGKAYTLLFACINPSISNLSETSSTISYCETIKSIKLNNQPIQILKDINISYNDELIFLRKFKENFDKIKKCDSSTSPIKISCIDSSNIELNLTPSKGKNKLSLCDYYNANIIDEYVSPNESEESIPNNIHSSNDEQNFSDIFNFVNDTNSNDKLSPTSKNLEISAVLIEKIGLSVHFNDSLKFKVLLLSTAQNILKVKNRSLTRHSFNILKKGASIQLRCSQYYKCKIKSLKCNCKYSINYNYEFDSIQIKAFSECNHFIN